MECHITFVVIFLSVNQHIMSKYDSVREMHEDSKNAIYKCAFLTSLIRGLHFNEDFLEMP